MPRSSGVNLTSAPAGVFWKPAISCPKGIFGVEYATSERFVVFEEVVAAALVPAVTAAIAATQRASTRARDRRRFLVILEGSSGMAIGRFNTAGTLTAYGAYIKSLLI